MLESLVASLLNRFLGSYVQNFDPNQLNIGIWGGDVKLNNLTLKREALDQLKLPLDIVDGHLGKLVLQIPWSNLKNKPVKILIEDVFLVAASKFDTFNDIDPDDEDRRAHILKLNKLEKYEVTSKIQSESSMSPEEARKQQSFTESLVNKIVDNLQITIRNIHVRFEDRSTGIPLSVGLSLEELSALSTDCNWNPSFIQESSSITWKLATLKSFSMYWNTDSELVRDSDDILHMMSKLSSKKIDDLQYILRPVSGVGYITLNKDSSGPAMKADLSFENLGFVFDNEQYRDIILIAEEFRKYQQIMEYVRFRPKVSVKKDPKAWFKYAGDVILKQVRDNRKQWSWKYILERRQDKLRYIELYKQRESAIPGGIPDITAEEFDLIEKKYPFSDLKFFRSLAKSELKKEKKHQPASEPQSWSSWFWGSPSATKEIAGEVVTEEQENEFYDAIEWDESQATNVLVDKSDVVVLEMSTTLKTGSFTLRSDPHSNRSYDVVNVLFNGFKLDFELQGGGNSFQAAMSLQDLRVDDGSPNTMFKRVVTVKSLNNNTLSQISYDENNNLHADSKNAFFNLTYEHNPLDGTADSKLFLKTQGLTVFYNKLVIENMARFFKPPKSNLQTIGTLLNKAGATVEEFRDLTRMGLEYALQKHKTLNLKMDIQAPLVVIPSDITDVESSCAVFDAGHISVESHLASKEIVERVQKKQSEPYNEDDWKTLESLMYDRYKVKLHNTQLMIGTSLRNTMKNIKLGFDNSNTILVDKLNLDFLIDVSILPDAHNITRFKASGNLPLLLASISDEKYRILMLIAESSIPNFNFETGPDDTDDETVDAFTGISVEVPALALLDESDDDTSTVVSQKQTASDRQLLEFDFGIDKVALSLNRCVSKSTLEQESLVDLSLYSFKFNLKVRDDGIVAHASLLDISVEDHIQKLPPGELTNIFSSADADNKMDKKLLTFVYNCENQNNHQAIDLDLLAVKFVVTPKTILSLMDFARSTFDSSTDLSQATTPKPFDQEVTDPKSNSDAASLPTTGKLDLKIQLHSIIIVLNDDGVKLATFKLDQAQADVKLISDDINVHARIGQLSLHDEINEGVSRNSLLRTLVSMENSDLAELRYQTFNHPSKPMDYSSIIYFRAGSMRINLVEEPLIHLSTFFSRFAQMKKFYDTARAAAMNQAKQIEGVDNIQFDVLISTPIVVIPRLTGPTNCDLLVFHLGDIFARNEFTNSVENNIVAGVRSIKLSSEIGDVPLDVLANVDLAFKAVYNTKTSITTVKGFLSDTHIKITDLQLEFLLQAFAALSRIVSEDSGLQDAEIDELGKELGIKDSLESLGLISDNTLFDERFVKDSNRLSLDFDARSIKVSLYNNTKSVKCDGEELEKFALSKFSLNKTKFSFEIKGNGDVNADIAIKSFTVEDTRHEKENCFTELIPAASESVTNQFISVVSLKKELNGKKMLKADLTVTNPRIILAIDYLVELKFFFEAAIPNTRPIEEKLGLETIAEEEDSDFALEYASEPTVAPLAIKSTTSSESKIDIEYSVKITDSSVILLSNPKLADTEAIVFKVDTVSLAQKDDVLKTNINEVGMFLCRMNRFHDNRLRIIDDFSITSVIDLSSGFISKVDFSCQALVLRLSLRDVLLALDIFQRATELASPRTTANSTSISAKNEHGDNNQVKSLANDRDNLSATLSRRRSSVALSRRRSSQVKSTPVEPIKKFVDQRLRAEFDGLRLVMIGTVHELPMIDCCVRPFTVTAKNWSEMPSRFFASTMMDTFLNIYNYEKSAWEPLIEPWKVSFEASKPKGDQIVIDVKSDMKSEVTITALTISTLNKTLTYFSEDVDFLNKTRENATLYRIENQTGFDVEVWATQNTTTSTSGKTVIKDGEEIPWNFEDWHSMRENLSVDSQNVDLGVKINGTPFDPLPKISVASIGETIYDLNHSRGGPKSQLLCDVVLTDTVKRIILRSPLTYENQTQVAVEMCLNPSNKTSRRWKIEPGQSRSVPISHNSREAVSFRPDNQYGFNWSENPVHWQNLLSRPKAHSCVASANPEVKFFIQFSIANKKVTRAATSGNNYPSSIRVVLTPPVEVTNLLPFDMTYRIYDKNTGKDWKNTLKKGATSAVHVVEPSRLLLLSVNPAPESGYGRSEFAVVNVPLGTNDFSREYQMLLRSNIDGQKLKLNIHYLDDDLIKGSSCKIQIYTPYLILNKTGLDLKLQSSFSSATSKVQRSNGHSEIMGVGTPKMWSFERNSRSNRTKIKIGSSTWSEPLSFDALGKDSEVVIDSELGQKSIYVGLHVAKGTGKYHLTKVVTLTPRFILHNELSRDIYIKDPGSNEVLLVSSGSLRPLSLLNGSSKRQLLASFDKKHWSSEFVIENVGRNHLRMLNSNGSVDSLLRINILVENATLYLHIEDSSKNWPFSIQNFTNYSFTVFQSNPYLDSVGYVDTSNKADFKPIEYTIEAKTSVPYAWDFPAAIVKELVINIEGQDRRVQFAEIGNLEPMKLDESGRKVLELNVVADGPTQALVITEVENTFSAYHIAASSSSSISGSSSSPSKENKQLDEGEVSMIVRVNLEGMGISLVNNHMQELCYATLQGASLQYRVSEIYETFTMKLKWLQIDNQLPNSLFPILLYPSIITQNDEELESHPTLSGSITKVRDDSYGVFFLKYATVLLQQISVQLDEEFVYALIDFADSKEVVLPQEDTLCDAKLVIPEPIKETSGLDMYFELLHIQPAQMDLSFVRTSERSIEDEDRGSSQNPLMFFFNVLTMALGNINDAPIRLNALLIENVRIPLPVLVQSIQTHYSQNFLYQMHKLLGSADFLGNPVGLFNNMSSGFMDLFYEPYQGYIINESPQDLGIGIAKGGLSFMKKSIFGISDSVSKFTGSISKGLSAATMDQAYQSRRNINRVRNRPSHALTGITSGANSFVEGITSGVSGLALAPMQGASEGGAIGFFKGLGKGLIGLPTKTAIGLLDMANNVSEGVRNTTTLFDAHSINRIRPPRFIARDGIIRPFDFEEAEAQVWLKTANKGQYYDDQFISHISLACDNRDRSEGKGKVVIITYNRIILLNTSSITTEWEVRFEELQAITMERTGLSLTLRGGVQGPFVPLRSSSDKKKMYHELGVAVSEFNKKLR